MVLCSREKEDQSPLVTALDSNRVDPTSLPSQTDVAKFLKQHFVVKTPGSMAVLDPEG